MCTCPPWSGLYVRLYILAQPRTPASSVQYRERRTTSISDQQSRFRHRFINKMMLQLQAVLVLCLVAGTWADSISPELQQRIVDWHNEYRLSKKSTNMNKIEWSEDAAAVAANLVKQCKRIHDSTRNHNLLTRPIKDDDFDATAFVDSALEHWAGTASNWWQDKGRPYQCTDWNRSTKEHWNVRQHPAMAISSKIGCAYTTCHLGKKSSHYYFAYDNCFSLVCHYTPNHYTYKTEKVFKTGGAPCSACTKGQTCDNGLCVGYRCTDSLGTWYCRSRNSIYNCKYRPIQWKQEVCPVTCKSCPK